MGLWEWLNGTDNTPQNRAEYRAAQDKLTRVANRDRRESDDFLFWNDRVGETQKKVGIWGWLTKD